MEDLKVTPEFLRQRVDQDAKVMAGINNCIKNANRNEKNLQTLRSKMSGEFRNLSNLETNHTIVSIYSELAGGYDNISKSHLAYIDQVDQKVLPVLVDYQRKIKDVKNAIATYQSKRTNLTKQELAYNRTTDPGKRDAAQKAFEKSQNEYTQESMNLNRRLKAYENDRMLDTKQVLLHTINAEMHYHAKALERLSELAFKVYSIDDKKEAQEALKTIINLAPQPQNPGPGQGQGQGQGQNPNVGVSQNIGAGQNMGQSQHPHPSQHASQNLNYSQNPRQNMGASHNSHQHQHTSQLVKPP